MTQQLPPCPGTCLRLVTDGQFIAQVASAGSEANATIMSCDGSGGPNGAVLTLRAQWSFSDLRYFRLRQKPGASRCLQPADSNTLGSSLGVYACDESEMNFFGTSLWPSGFELQTRGGQCVGRIQEQHHPAPYLGLVACNESHPHRSVAQFSARCMQCPAAPLPPSMLAAFIFVLSVLAVSPACIGHRSRAHGVSATLWPGRRRLSGLSGVLVHIGWLIALMSVTPLALWALADAWPGDPGWYLAMLGPACALLLLMIRPTDPPHILRILYSCAFLFFTITTALAFLLVLRWSGQVSTGGPYFAVLTVRDSCVCAMSFSSIVVLFRVARRTIFAAKRVSFSDKEKGASDTSKSAMAVAKFRLVIRTDAAILGLIWLADAIARVSLHPMVELRSQTTWANIVTAISMLLTAKLMQPSWTLRLQIMRSPLDSLKRRQPHIVYAPRGDNDFVTTSAADEKLPSPSHDAHHPLGYPFTITSSSTKAAADLWLEGQGHEQSLVIDGLKLGQIIGSGGFAKVHRAETKEGGVVAVKVIYAFLAEGQASVKRLREEIAFGMQLTHQHVCKTIGLAVCYDCPAVVMELCEGGTAYDRFIRKSDGGGALMSGMEATRISYEAALGLAYLHEQGVQHRDVKPENILLDAALHAKISDFGLSSRDSVEKSTTQTGTLRYLAPEAIFVAFTMNADVYSFGMTVYAIMHGRVPFDDYAPIAVAHMVVAERKRPAVELSTDLAPIRDIITACWNGDADARPEMARVVDDFEKIVSPAAA